MTPQERAERYSKLKREKALDWSKDVLAEAWMEGYLSNPENYCAQVVIDGMKAVIDRLNKELYEQGYRDNKHPDRAQ